MNAQFLVAKYIPDLKRMEPRNIGIVVWHNGDALARFLGEDEETGAIHPPPRRIGVRDKRTYQRWIASWRRLLEKPALELGRGEVVEKSSPQYLKALCEWSRGNYMLVEGGEVSDAINEGELPALTDYLYREAVAVEEDIEKKEYEYEKLRVESTRLLKTTGISERKDFKRQPSAWYKIRGVLRYTTFDFAIGPTELPRSVFHRVLLANSKSFDSTFLRIEHFLESHNFARERFAAMVHVASRETKEQKDNRKLLEKLVTVINVADVKSAPQQLEDVASSGGKA